jgi:hypothetical protein
LLRGPFFIRPLLRLASLALAFGGALFRLRYILTQLAVAAEQAAVIHYKLRLLAFFVCHISPD